MADIALILSADKYSIPDAKTGEIQHLHQVWMSNDYRVATDTEKGCKPMKVLVEPTVFADIMKCDLPALFNVDVKMRPGKGNALAATVVGFQFIGAPKIFEAAAKAMGQMTAVVVPDPAPVSQRSSAAGAGSTSSAKA